MSFKSNELKVVDIDLENGYKDKSRNSSRNSFNDEVNSHYSYTDSDLHDFQKMEKDIYGSCGDDESSQDHNNMQEGMEEDSFEQTESLEFLRPHVPIRPSLGDAFDTYDQLQKNFDNLNDKIIENGLPADISHPKSKEKPKLDITIMSPPHKSRGSSRASGGSAETVLSQSQQINEVPSIHLRPDKHPKKRSILSSISSAESIEKSSKKRNSNRANLKTLLDQEKATRQSQEIYIDHLQQSLNQLLSQHALAKETIDQLRLGIALNINETNNRPKLRRQHFHKHPSSSNNTQTLNRRYSSFVGDAEVPDYMGRSSDMFRAKSVDNGIFEESPPNEISNQPHPDGEFGGSLKYVKNESPTSQGLSREIANDFQRNFDKFQTRVEIIEQAIEELSMYIDGGASGSSGSQYGEIDVSSDRHQADTENRLQNILMAYDNLQKDFSQVCRVWKDTAINYIPVTKTIHNLDSTEQIEGSLFQLRMQLDNLERHVSQARQSQPTHQLNPSSNNSQRNQELINRFGKLEDEYRQLMNRYNDLKRMSSPSRQKDMDDIVIRLKSIVTEANGRSSKIATPEVFESMLHQDLIESMKRHLVSDSPPYFLTEEDGLSSANSSLGKGRSKRKKGRRSEDNLSWKPQPNERLSPTKSSTSHRSNEIKRPLSSSNQSPKYGSQPVSLVSSTSGGQGATSGETLPVDERGIFKEPTRRRGSRSTNDIFKRPKNKPEVLVQKSQSFTNSVDLGSRPNSSGFQNLDDDVKRLDEHLARIELEEKNQPTENILNRDSDAAVSRNTRSLLGTSPSNSNYSRHSKPVSSAGSSHRSGKSRSSKQGDDHSDSRKNRQSYHPAPESTDSGGESASCDEDIEDYVKLASCGMGARSRYVRKKNINVQDRWSQTPLRLLHKSPRSRPFLDECDMSPMYNGPYIDDVAYWDGVAFHPAREGLPGKSILRQSPPHSKNHRNHFHKVPISPYSDTFTRPSSIMPSRTTYPQYPTEPVSLREYATLAPHRYFVREYGQFNRMYPNHPAMHDSRDDYNGEDDDEYPYRKYIEERRLCNYLDEAIKAARDMKQYTRRLTDICEQRQTERDYMNSYHGRSFRPLYT